MSRTDLPRTSGRYETSSWSCAGDFRPGVITPLPRSMEWCHLRIAATFAARDEDSVASAVIRLSLRRRDAGALAIQTTPRGPAASLSQVVLAGSSGPRPLSRVLKWTPVDCTVRDQLLRP